MGESGVTSAPIDIIVATISIATLTTLYVYLYNPSVYAIAAVVVIFLGLGGAILGFEIYKQRKMTKIDKGRKIIEIKQRGFEILPKSLNVAMILVCCILAFGAVVNAIVGNMIFLALVSVLIANLTIFLSERRYEIYEKGITYGVTFVKWDEIKKVEWKDGILSIKTGKVIGSIRIKDRNENIREVIEDLIRHANGERDEG